MTKHPLRMFTPLGMSEFLKRWNLASESGTKLSVQDMLEHPEWTMRITEEPVVELTKFSNRMHCGKYFYDLFKENQPSLRAASIDPAVSVELWAWLSAFWGDWLQQKDGTPLKLGNGGTVGEKSRWVFEPNNRRRYYRHLLAGPYLIMAANDDEPQRAQILLYNPVVTPNTRWVETICGSEEVIFNKRLLGALSTHLLDSSGQPTPSAARLTRRNTYFAKRDQDEVGTIDRLTQVYNQLVQTWDLNATDLQQMRNLFGDEFTKFFA